MTFRLAFLFSPLLLLLVYILNKETYQFATTIMSTIHHYTCFFCLERDICARGSIDGASI